MSKRYTDGYKSTIVELYNSGKILAELTGAILPLLWILTMENSMSKNMNTTLAIKILDNALKIHKPAEGLILHSDLGS